MIKNVRVGIGMRVVILAKAPEKTLVKRCKSTCGKAEKAVKYKRPDVEVCLMCSSNSMESSMHKVER